MTKKEQERRFVDQAIADLKWDARVLAENDGPPAEPPDFDVEREGKRIGVEVRRVYRNEGAVGGSPAAAREGIWQGLVRDLAKRYYAASGARPIMLTARLPAVIDSPSVRPISSAELAAEVREIADRALAVLLTLHLAPGEDHDFNLEVPRRGAARFSVRGLPDEPRFSGYRRWQIANRTLGWVGSFDGPELEAAVKEKAELRDRSGYAARYHATALLLVADGSVASGFNELGRGPVPSHGFDEIYFLEYGGRGTQRVARREDPVERKEASEILDLASRGSAHESWCFYSRPAGEPCRCAAAQTKQVLAAMMEVLGVAWDVTVVEGEPDGDPGTFITREEADRLRDAGNRAKEAIAEVVRIASGIGHANPSGEGRELHAAAEKLRAVATPRRPSTA